MICDDNDDDEKKERVGGSLLRCIREKAKIKKYGKERGHTNKFETSSHTNQKKNIQSIIGKQRKQEQQKSRKTKLNKVL